MEGDSAGVPAAWKIGVTDCLTATPDPSFDRLARVVRDALGVPVALVSVVEPDRQVFPGASGLPEPYESSRNTPLSHSFCQYVVADDAPLIIEDARLDARLMTNLAIPDLGVVAYAGFPLRDVNGRAIGSVCAIDDQPHAWTERELRIVEDLARLCSAELELRASKEALIASVTLARDLANRARLLLSLSERLAETVTTTDIAAALQDVAAKHLECVHAGVWLLNEPATGLEYIPHPSQAWPQAEEHTHFDLDGSNPIAAPLLGQRPLFLRDRSEQDALYPQLAAAAQAGEAQARALMPLTVGGVPLGTLVLLWEHARSFSDQDQTSIAALTSYTSQAVQRALLLAERSGVATTMQLALLTDLPNPPGLQMAARYRTAALSNEVGGDWYDAVVLPSGDIMLAIGDVTGHDVEAAATMGGLRNMLRTLAWAIDDSPARIVERLDQAADDLGMAGSGTLILGRLRRAVEAGSELSWHLSWSSAGHSPGVLIDADGVCTVLDDGAASDCMLGVVPHLERRDQQTHLPAGCTLFFYTDGLIERRGSDLDEGLRLLQASLARHHDRPLEQLMDSVLDELIGDAPDDDVAVLAVRLGPALP